MPQLLSKAGPLLKTLLQAAALAAAFLPIIAAAQPVFNGGGLPAGLAAATGITGVATGTLDMVVEGALFRVTLYAGLAALVVVTIAGFYLILGLGEDSSKDKAKKIIMYTLIGLGVVFFATFIVNFMQFIVGSDGDPGGEEVVLGILERVVSFTALIATVVIVIAGFYLVLGLGEDSSKDKAKKIILYTFVGVMLIGLAAVIVGTMYFILGAPGANGGEIKQVVAKIVKAILSYLALIATITVIIAGFYLVLSNGDDAGKDKAKKIIMYTLAGLIVVLFARIIVGFITDTIETTWLLRESSHMLTYNATIVR
jgi:multisubunit Na+/H+ antiporter MnhB subunit